MKPIPENARPRDPRWTIAFLDLAHGLVMAGAKGRIIERFTHLSHRKVRKLYKALRRKPPPAGPVMQGSARYFAKWSKRVPTEWSIQSTIFVGCYERMSKITTMRVQRGWLLLAAFNSYLSLTEKLHETTSVKRLDINQAYALLSYCGFMTMASGAKLERRHCPTCSINYLAVADEEPDTQACPVCAINAKCERVSHKICLSDNEDPSPKIQ